MKILGVIPARSGSKGVKNKNLRLIDGKPLISYIIETSKRISWLDDLIVSTDSVEIAEFAQKKGIKIPFLRPPELAADNVSLVSVSKHALDFYDKNIFKSDIVVSLQPTSPLLSDNSINQAIEIFLNGDFDSIVSVSEIKHFHPFRAYKMNGSLVEPLTEYTNEKYLQKQERPPAFGFTGGLYIRKRELLSTWKGDDFALGKKIGGVVVNEEEAIDIDSELDLLLFKTILKHRTLSK